MLDEAVTYIASDSRNAEERDCSLDTRPSSGSSRQRRYHSVFLFNSYEPHSCEVLARNSYTVLNTQETAPRSSGPKSHLKPRRCIAGAFDRGIIEARPCPIVFLSASETIPCAVSLRIAHAEDYNRVGLSDWSPCDWPPRGSDKSHIDFLKMRLDSRDDLNAEPLVSAHGNAGTSASFCNHIRIAVVPKYSSSQLR